MDYNNQMDIDY